MRYLDFVSHTSTAYRRMKAESSDEICPSVSPTVPDYLSYQSRAACLRPARRPEWDLPKCERSESPGRQMIRGSTVAHGDRCHSGRARAYDIYCNDSHVIRIRWQSSGK